MGDFSKSFPKSEWVRPKHAEKSRVGLWGQSLSSDQQHAEKSRVDLESSRAVSKLVVDVSKRTTYERFWPTRTLSEVSMCKCCSVWAVEKLTTNDVTWSIHTYNAFWNCLWRKPPTSVCLLSRKTRVEALALKIWRTEKKCYHSWDKT